MVLGYKVNKGPQVFSLLALSRDKKSIVVACPFIQKTKLPKLLSLLVYPKKLMF